MSDGTEGASSNPLRHSQFVEYRILYSNDIVQKSKIWHDGHCKFFKFNKKLIIYNEEGTVAGTHFLHNGSLLDQYDKPIKIADAIWIIVEEKLGEYERDISKLVTGGAGAARDNGDLGKIVNRRIENQSPVTPSSSSKISDKENRPLGLSTKVTKKQNTVVRRVGLSRLASPSYLAKVQQSNGKALVSPQPQTSAAPPHSASKVQDLVNPRIVKKHSVDVTPEFDMSKVFSVYSENHSSTDTPTKQKQHHKSTIDVFASDGEQDISEEVSDLEVDSVLEEDVLTQTRTYNFT